MKGDTLQSEARSSGTIWSRSWAGIGVLFLMFAAALLLASCGNTGDEPASGGGEETAPSGEEAESAGEAQAVSLADLTDNPSEFYGKRVTVSGIVTDQLGPDSFAIGGDEFVGGNSVPVMSAQPMDQVVANPELLEENEGALVQATGTVQEFNQINNDDVASDLNSEVFSSFGDNQAALIADSVTITPQQGGGTTMQAAQGVQVSLSAITDQPTEFYGQTVTVSGPVARVVEPNAYVIVSDQTMDGGGELDTQALANQGVLVVDQSGASVNEGETSQVTGVVQQFDLDQLEEDYGVSLENPNNEVYSAFGGRPAIVVGAGGGTTG
ncbi:MAG TPA: hypothetical protein VFE21_10240 [Rubrobacteraceae bacterium]|nr:hypothetical protein [Rubrobacteraceae bacterium]